MSKDPQNGLECSQFEALLADALDSLNDGQADALGGLTPEQRRAFEAHRLSCAICGPMLAEVRQGLTLLRGLPEVDPPKNLVHNILVRTSRAQAAAEAAGAPVPAGGARRWLQSLRPSFAWLWHSRFATSFAMAFFSLSLTLTLAGVRITDLAKVDWRPSALRKSIVLRFTNVEASVMRYYENMRLVVEVESRVQQLKKATTPPSNNNNRPEQQNWNRPGDNGRPEKQENVVQERDDPPLHAQAGFAEGPTRCLNAKFMMKDEGAHL
jgi:hypothetical protein